MAMENSFRALLFLFMFLLNSFKSESAVASIDLGSEWIKVAVVNLKPGQPPISIAINEMSKCKTPSLISFHADSRLIGEESSNLLARYPNKVYHLSSVLAKPYDFTVDFLRKIWLLLSTLPVLISTLVMLVLGNVIDLGTVMHAVISTVSVIVYFCCFVMGFGPIPNILFSEIFPTRVRGICIAICALTFWIGDIIVTYSLPVMLNSIGLAGVFSIYAVVCIIAWIFVFLKVPETKGMPLEVITEFFAMGAKQSATNVNN